MLLKTAIELVRVNFNPRKVLYIYLREFRGFEMGTLVLNDVVIEEISNGTVFDGAATQYEYIKISGVRHRKFGVDNYLDNFLKKAYKNGEKVSLACRKSFGVIELKAIKMSDGEVIKSDLNLAFNRLMSTGIGGVNAVTVAPAIAVLAKSWTLYGILVFLVPIMIYVLMKKSSIKVRSLLD